MYTTLNEILDVLKWLIDITAADHTGVAGYAAQDAVLTNLRNQLREGRIPMPPRGS